MRKILSLLSSVLLLNSILCSQNVSVSIDATKNKKLISPYIYGKNNSLSDNQSSPTQTADISLIQDAGVKFVREFGGNNGTKYNWREKITSHPDWYNNVYKHDWDFAATELQNKLPGVQGMWSFQLIGYAASTTASNFNDWEYNSSKWWQGVCQNLAGSGTPNESGGCDASKEGDPSLYLQTWTADSTVGILKHWFSADGLDLNKDNFKYWSMDNEPEIWNGTHDDILSDNISAEAFMQRYFETAKKARAEYPGIKLCGPVAANEWQWYAWNNSKIDYNGSKYTWLEYFILRCAEEQKSSGIRLLDVLDIHFYPTEQKNEDIVQIHRVFFDKNYSYPGANGVKMTSSNGWDNSLTNEYIFERCNQWLAKYMGTDHNVNLGLSEFGATHNNAMTTAVSYASMLGTFSENNVEIFSPWTWQIGMWEAVHLFSRYSQEYSVSSTSGDENNVSAFSSVNELEDSMTVILVNKNILNSKTVDITISNFSFENGNYKTLQLEDLPETETFISHTNNALKTSTIKSTDGSSTITLPPLSITAILLTQKASMSTGITSINTPIRISSTFNSENIRIKANGTIKNIKLYNEQGILILENSPENVDCKINTSSLSHGLYVVKIYVGDEIFVEKIIL